MVPGPDLRLLRSIGGHAPGPARIQAKVFSDEIEAVLRRYELRQISSAEVVERLVDIAKRLRDARHRHEQLGLTEEEAAFYDALGRWRRRRHRRSAPGGDRQGRHEEHPR
jgi:hypothetical protein